MDYAFTQEFAGRMDEKDPLRHFREKFYIPFINGKESVYFTGNSLGLQPRTAQDYVVDEMEDWANYGVEGHFHARNPWYSYHELFPELLSDILGARAEEIVVMNQLTVNLHVLLTTFYRPDKKRFKIICEGRAFPSDLYAFDSQVKLHGLQPEDTIIKLFPRDGEQVLRTEDIEKSIRENAGELALVILGGVNYYSGQVMDMKKITAAAHAAGAICGFDLAHAAGNVHLELNAWQVDFACWCSYKYLNSGPGGVAGAFIHEQHIQRKDLPRLAGWWGHNKETRFKMPAEFDPIPTAEGWQLSNAPVLSMAAHRAALEIFKEANMGRLVEKSKLLTGYLFYVLDEINNRFSSPVLEAITPRGEDEHGCQVSIIMKQHGREIFEGLLKQGVISDWREPDVIRVAPVPLYNSFSDIFRFGTILLGECDRLHQA